MKNILLATLVVFLLNSIQNLDAEEIKALRSPNKNLEVVLQLSKESELTYSFKAGNKVLIANSPLG